MLIKHLGLNEVKERFLPAQASDIFPHIVRKAKQGIIGLTKKDLALYYRHLKDLDFDKIFTPACSKKYPPEIQENFLHKYFIISDEIKRGINFKLADVREEAQKKFDGPTFAFIRNLTHCLSPDDAEFLIMDIYKNLDSGSMLIVGQTEVPPLTAGYFSPVKILINRLFEPVPEACGEIACRVFRKK